MVALTVCYKSDVAFNADYYNTTHLPLVSQSLGGYGMKNSEIRKIVGTPTRAPAPYQLIATFYFDDASTVQRALESAEGQAVVADIPNFYPAMPDVMIGEVDR